MIGKGAKYSGQDIRAYIILPVFMLVSLFLLSGVAIAQSQIPANEVGKSRPMTDMDSVEVKQLFFKALRERTVENLTLASELFDRVIKIDPKNDASLYELATIDKTKNDYAGARSLLERAVAVNPDNEWYWVSLADCYEKSNDIAKLENVFNQLTRINPDKPEYYYDKANAYFLQQRYDDALKVYEQLEQITGANDDILANRQKIYLKQGKVDLAAAQLDQLIAANPTQTKYYIFLYQLYNANNFNDKALKTLLTAEKVDPNSGLVHLGLADMYRDKKDYEKSYYELTLAFAIPDVDIDQKLKIILGYLPKFPDPNARASALELSKILTVTYPNDARAFAIYGDMLLQNDKLKDAADNYRKSIAINSQLYEVQEQLVRIEIGNNELDAAVKDGQIALSLFPNQAWMNYLVGIALLQKKDYHKALSYLKDATSLETQDKDLLTQSFSALGDCYHDLKDDNSAYGAYDKALVYNPDNAFTLNNYAYYLSEKGEQLDKAAKMSKHSIDVQTGNASFEDTYAWVLFKQKDYAQAKIWIEKALVDDKGGSAGKIEHYGDILYFLGNVDGAVENWSKAKAKGGTSPTLDKKINEKKYVE